MSSALPRHLSFRVSTYAAMLAAAGVPLYIHLPQFATRELGISLATLGTVLGLLRLLDLVQDPALGWLVDRFQTARRFLATVAGGMMALGFLMLFSFPAVQGDLLRPTLGLILIFSGFSLGTILLYSQSAALAAGNEARMLRLAGFREGGSLAGVILAAAAPAALIAAGPGYSGFGWALAVLCLATTLGCRPMWTATAAYQGKLSFGALRKSGALSILGLAFLNSLPVAMTSTLFLFFVEDRLLLPALSGPFLILFFLSAALSVPFWTGAARRLGPRLVLMPAMSIAIAAFIGAALLSPGAAIGFAIVCAGSGAALGADMVLLPLMFSLRLKRAGVKAGQAFGLWSAAAKLALAAAAVLLLPLLAALGYTPGSGEPDGLFWLTLAYAVLPCLVKLLAIFMVAQLPREGALA